MICYMFPGQGSQHKGMGEKLFQEFPEEVAAADEILGYSIRSLCVNDEAKQLGQTQFTQPALYVVNYLTYKKKIKDSGSIPKVLLGHSLGEYNALHAAGAFNFETGLKLVAKRGELMSTAPKGAMAAVIAIPAEKVEEIVNDAGLQAIDIANFNSPMQTIISGLEADIIRAQDIFEANGATYIRLNTSGAFHSRYMKEAKATFNQYLEQFEFSPLEQPVISNVYAEPYKENSIVETLAAQIASPVRWVESVNYLRTEHETIEFEEVGPGDVLTKLVKQIKGQPLAPTAKPSRNIANKSEEDIKSKLPQDLEAKIAAWNERYPVGTHVTVDGYDQTLETRTGAQILFGHRAAIYLKDYKGYFALEEVRPL